MDIGLRLEQELEQAVGHAASGDSPPLLARALRHAVFPGGARIRPRLVLAVSNACASKKATAATQNATAATQNATAASQNATAASQNASAAITFASSVELLHCASLVHDDLPCFDNSELRRGKPSVHVAFGERIAVLAGDALIVLGFEWLALRTERVAQLSGILARCVGGPSGICAGQAWECEPTIDIVRYQRAKTGALFAACTMGGAASQGYEPFAWQKLGFAIGEAFQVADDLRDVAGSAEKLGKPVHQDEANHAPNFVSELGFDGAMGHFEELLEAARNAIPDCPGREALAQQIEGVSRSLVTGLQARTAAA
ncbi:polyprenyl synthetase family protein [Aestuariivirga sp.]|uniref:polyprenyl synthetase family protein n=1 Tax=Aestuariivirga sp. TaxID=2650926 RepID=UPI0025C1F2DC|nr:polyprenyl synthetase family protein [Aestuariivirga sp.]MCA3555763.1 polyprenyl synthetase family protein [Aestuariivirga sp.]